MTSRTTRRRPATAPGLRIGLAVAGVVVALLMVVGPLLPRGGLGGKGFTYRVRVQDSYADFGLPDAHITLEVQGLAPLSATTNSDGRASLRVDGSYVGQAGRLSILMVGYETLDQAVEVAQGVLPGTVRLLPIGDPARG